MSLLKQCLAGLKVSNVHVTVQAYFTKYVVIGVSTGPSISIEEEIGKEWREESRQGSLHIKTRCRLAPEK